MRRRIIAGLIVTAGLATAGVAYAENQPPDPSVAVTKAAATGAPSPAAAGGRAAILKGAVHGDLLVRDRAGSTRTVTFDRGKVTALAAGAITIERPDGVSVTETVTDSTVFNGIPRDQLTAGTPAIVVSESGTATHVVTRGAGAQPAVTACAGTPADGTAAGGANAGGNGVGQGPRARIKERICQRIERRQQRRAGRGGLGGTGQGGLGGTGQGGTGQGGLGVAGPAAGPSSMVDDGLKTIIS